MYLLLNILRFACVVVISGLFLSACGGPVLVDSAQLSKPLASASGRLKIVRTDELVAGLAGARLRIDDKEVANLDSGEWEVIDVPAGKHKITVDHWGHLNVFNLDLDVKPGTLYSLEISPRGEAVAAGAIFGLAGALVEAAANDNGGTFQIRVVEEKPVSG